MNIKKCISRYKHNQIKKILCNSDPEKLAASSDKLVISAFRRASSTIPAYKEILKKHHIQENEVISIKDFKNKVPVITKKDFFIPFDAEKWVGRHRFSRIKNFMTSSGFSGTFAFGAETGNTAQIRNGVDFTLDYLFNTSEKSTLIINCVPMGVHVITSLPLAETSVRSDMVIAMAKKISPKFEQTIIVGDPHFLKKLIEEGIAGGVDWKKINVSLICGQDWFPESFRAYMAHLTGMDIYNDKSRMIIATMGMTELGLNIFHESFETISIRQHAQQNSLLRKDIFGGNGFAVPFLFHYYPGRNYIEEITDDNDSSGLLFSVLNKNALIPLLRYDSGDSGLLIPFIKLAEILKTHQLENLTPGLKLPLAGIKGRKNDFIVYRDNALYPADIKLGLYEDFDLAGKTTGYFRLSLFKNSPLIELQLKPGILPDKKLTSDFSHTLLKYINIDVQIKCFTYPEFPYGMELSYEHKFINIKT